MLQAIDIHTHYPAPSDLAVRSVRLGVEQVPERGLCAAAIHPWDANIEPERVAELLGGLRAESVVAIGECGADYTTGLDRKAQLLLFEKHLLLAKEVNKPLIIHSVKAQNEIVAMLRREGFTRAVFHSFVGSAEQAREIVKAGCKISFGPRSFASPRTMKALTMLRGEDIFFETDMSTDSVVEIYDKAAEIRCESREELMEEVWRNFEEWFCAE